MDVTLARFVAALRRAELRVSPAETLDALAVVNCIGLEDPVLLRDALELTLAKSREEKTRFAECFARFFEQLAFRTPAKQSFFRGIDREAAEMPADVARADDRHLHLAMCQCCLHRPATGDQSTETGVRQVTMLFAGMAKDNFCNTNSSPWPANAGLIRVSCRSNRCGPAPCCNRGRRGARTVRA